VRIVTGAIAMMGGGIETTTGGTEGAPSRAMAGIRIPNAIPIRTDIRILRG